MRYQIANGGFNVGATLALAHVWSPLCLFGNTHVGDGKFESKFNLYGFTDGIREIEYEVEK